MHIGIPNPHCRYIAIIDEKELKEVRQHEYLSHLIFHSHVAKISKEANMILVLIRDLYFIEPVFYCLIV